MGPEENLIYSNVLYDEDSFMKNGNLEGRWKFRANFYICL